MESFEKPENFNKQGFVIIRNVLSSKEVSTLRYFIQKLLADKNNPRSILPSEIYQYPELYLLPFREKVIKNLKSALGQNLCYFPDLTVQHNMFGIPGWHTDAGSEGNARYLTDPDYRFAKCGIYLQDNTVEWGGGIVVIPSAHKFLVSTSNHKVDFLFKRILDRLSMHFSLPHKPITIDSKAGDFIFFDSRLPHTSTAPSNMSSLNFDSTNAFVTGIPDQNTKLVVYWDACNSEMKSDFLANAERRAKKEVKGGEHFFSGWQKYFFPDDFHEDYVTKAKTCKIEIASWDKNKCKEFESLFKEISIDS